MCYSFDEAVLIKQSYDEMGIFSEIKEKKNGYICEISKKWLTYDCIIPQIGDSYYLKSSSSFDCKLVTILGFSQCDNVVFVTFVSESGEEDEHYFSSFCDFKTTPWTDKDRISYFFKYDFMPCLPKILLGLLISGILIVFMLLLFNCDFSFFNANFSESSEFSIIFKEAFDIAFPLFKYILLFIILSSVMSMLCRFLKR